MKYIKRYESIEDTYPQIGDYVICQEADQDTELQEFLENNIGQVVPIPTREMGWDKRVTDFIWVKFENNSKSLSFRNYRECDIRPFFKGEIIHFSPKKEDMEAILSAKKYNL